MDTYRLLDNPFKQQSASELGGGGYEGLSPLEFCWEDRYNGPVPCKE